MGRNKRVLARGPLVISRTLDKGTAPVAVKEAIANGDSVNVSATSRRNPKTHQEEVSRVRNPAGPDNSADFSYVTYRRRNRH